MHVCVCVLVFVVCAFVCVWCARMCVCICVCGVCARTCLRSHFSLLSFEPGWVCTIHHVSAGFLQGEITVLIDY